MHKNAVGHAREEIIRQIMDEESSVKDYANYMPIGNAAQKIKGWVDQGAEIVYMTSRKNRGEVQDIQDILERNNFPKGILEYRKQDEEYKDMAERIMPDILIEDDCESIGGENEMTFPRIRPDIKERTKSIVVKEFQGINHLPDDINSMLGR